MIENFKLINDFLRKSKLFENKNMKDYKSYVVRNDIIYYHTNESGGFDFICSTRGKVENEIIFHGYACFDGVRHLHFGMLDNSYLNYPVLDDLTQALIMLNKLELKLCSDFI